MRIQIIFKNDSLLESPSLLKEGFGER